MQVSAFSSKFDAFLKGNYTLTATEQAGYNLFKGKANCNSCHLDGRGTALTSGQADNTMVAQTNPMFTCFGSSNLGLPLNPRNAFFYQTTPDFVGFTANPFGFGYRDLGLGTFLRSGFGTWASPNASWTQFAPANDGLMQVSTARNVAMTPPQCPTTEAPGPYFQKEFFHNGYIKSLKQLVHFYNTRDVYPFNVTSGHCPPGTTEKVNCWPRPEVPNNIDRTVGNLGLTDAEEDQIVEAHPVEDGLLGFNRVVEALAATAPASFALGLQYLVVGRFEIDAVLFGELGRPHGPFGRGLHGLFVALPKRIGVE